MVYLEMRIPVSIMMPSLRILMLFAGLIFGGIVSAQLKPEATPTELKKLKEDADLRKGTYEALLNAEKAKRDYEAALDPTKQADADQSASLKSVKESAEAQTATANAQKAQYEAELAALKKKFGESSGSGISGTAEITGAAGSAEATLLGSAAVQDIADKFAKALVVAGLPDSYILVTSTTVPDFQALTAFEAQFLGMKTAMFQARESSSTKATDNQGAKLESIAAVGMGLAAVGNILSFIKTDYNFVPLEVTSSNAMLLHALAGKLIGKKVEIPTLYVADAMSATNEILTKVAEISKWTIEAKSRIKFYEESSSAFEKSLAGSPNDDTLKNGLQKAQDSLATWKAILESLEAWSKKMTTSDEKGNSPMAIIIQQSSIKRKLENGAALVILELHTVTGTGYTKKNLWSSLGKNPFFVMGGAVASYIALDGKDGTVLSSQLLPVHGGYHSVSEIGAVVNRGTRAP